MSKVEVCPFKFPYLIFRLLLFFVFNRLENIIQQLVNYNRFSTTSEKGINWTPEVYKLESGKYHVTSGFEKDDVFEHELFPGLKIKLSEIWK